ncbi:MAG TPA: glycosyltransferase family 39 protein [Anaerolineae bacterium]
MNEPEIARAADSIARRLLGGLSFILVIIGQMTLFTQQDALAAGLILNLTGAVLFVWSSVRQPPRGLVALVERTSLTASSLLIGLAVCLSALAAVLDVLIERSGRTNYLPVLVLWVGSIITCLAAFSQDGSRSWRVWLKDHRRELITIGLITLGAAIVRFEQLGQIPRVINGDEGLIGQFALQTDRTPLANPFALFESIGGLYMQAIGLALQVFGHMPFALRLLPAIGGTLAIPALYLLTRRLFGQRAALLAAILLAVAHAHIHFSRTVAVMYIQSTFFAPLELYLFMTALEKRSTLRAAIGGLVLSLHFSLYVSALIIVAFLVVYLLVTVVVSRSLIRNARRQIVVFWLSAMLIALPQIVYDVGHPSEFMGRLNADGTVQSGWLANEMARTGNGMVQIVLERVGHVLLSLNYYPAQEFYGATIPVLDIVTSTFFVIGLVYALWRTRDHRYLFINGYFWSIVVSIGLFSIPPDADSYRVLAALPAAIAFAAIGLDRVLNLLSLHDQRRRIASVGVPAFILLAILAINLKAYHFDFAERCRFGGGLVTRFASYLGNYLGTLDRETSVYLLSTEEIRYGTHLSVDFLSRGLPVTNIPGPAAGIRLDPDTVVIAGPTRMGELRDWTLDHPGGTLHYEFDCEQPMLLSYHLP